MHGYARPHKLSETSTPKSIPSNLNPILDHFLPRRHDQLTILQIFISIEAIVIPITFCSFPTPYSPQSTYSTSMHAHFLLSHACHHLYETHCLHTHSLHSHTHSINSHVCMVLIYTHFSYLSPASFSKLPYPCIPLILHSSHAHHMFMSPPSIITHTFHTHL